MPPGSPQGSVNPPDLVRQVEIGTSPLTQRLAAANRMFAADWFRRELTVRFPEAAVSYIV